MQPQVSNVTAEDIANRQVLDLTSAAAAFSNGFIVAASRVALPEPAKAYLYETFVDLAMRFAPTE